MTLTAGVVAKRTGLVLLLLLSIPGLILAGITGLMLAYEFSDMAALLKAVIVIALHLIPLIVVVISIAAFKGAYELAVRLFNITSLLWKK